ncbi:MAG: hypothetical protein KGZ88_03830 [Methylomicrobium sp.]|nr:hypothetical protein [Methylomicrobium sp.]
MSLINWAVDQYGTNVGFADEEHQILFGKLNKLNDLATGEADVTEEVGQMVKVWLDSHIPAFYREYSSVLS